MSKVKDIKAREILDSRGTPTLEVEVFLESGASGKAAIPSGASTGKNEAYELRDADKKRFFGNGVSKAVKNIKGEIFDCLSGFDFDKQSLVDQKLISLDGTENKKRLGANSILGVSLAVARACADESGSELFQYLASAVIPPLMKTTANRLPVPMMNIINGGRHANNPIEIQEFMILPISAKTVTEAIRMGAEVFFSLKNVLSNKDLSIAVGDEGGFAPALQTTEDALNCMSLAVEKTAYEVGSDIVFALDAAANEFYSNKKYVLDSERSKLTSDELIKFYDRLVSKFPIFSIEDGMAEEDLDGWVSMTAELGGKVQLVGDDVFVTNQKYLERGIQKNIANAILIKVNQVGTLTETLNTIKIAKESNYATVMSHRSGETEDSFIADLSVAAGCSQIKAGSLSRSERVAKYNRLMKIEESLGNSSEFYGKLILDRFS
jgi:enolase